MYIYANIVYIFCIRGYLQENINCTFLYISMVKLRHY